MKQQKITLFLFLFLSIFQLRGLAVASQIADVEPLFFKANQAYQAGNYDEALAGYEEILTKGVLSGAVFYNMGNAYFRKQEYGQALLQYERAKRLIPGDEDLFANLALVRRLLPQVEKETEETWYQHLFKNVRDSLSAGRWSALAAGLYISFFLLLSLSFYSSKGRDIIRRYLPYHGVLLVMVLVLASASVLHRTRFQKAVVITSEATVRYSPTYSGSVAFQAPEGVEAEVLRRDGDWVYARFSRGKAGWVEGHEVGLVDQPMVSKAKAEG